MLGRPNEMIIDEKVTAILNMPAGNGRETIAEVLLNGTYSPEDLKAFATDAIFPNNKDYGNKANDYTSGEVAIAFVKKISPYLSERELFKLTESMLEVEIAHSDGPLRKPTLARALLFNLLINAQPGKTGELPALFLKHITSEAVMNKIFPESKRTAQLINLTIHDLFIGMLAESKLISTEQEIQYGYKPKLLEKVDSRKFEDYSSQVGNAKDSPLDVTVLSEPLELTADRQREKSTFLKSLPTNEPQSIRREIKKGESKSVPSANQSSASAKLSRKSSLHSPKANTASPLRKRKPKKEEMREKIDLQANFCRALLHDFQHLENYEAKYGLNDYAKLQLPGAPTDPSQEVKLRGTTMMQLERFMQDPHKWEDFRQSPNSSVETGNVAEQTSNKVAQRKPEDLLHTSYLSEIDKQYEAFSKNEKDISYPAFKLVENGKTILALLPRVTKEGMISAHKQDRHVVEMMKPREMLIIADLIYDYANDHKNKNGSSFGIDSRRFEEAAKLALSDIFRDCLANCQLGLDKAGIFTPNHLFLENLARRAVCMDLVNSTVAAYEQFKNTKPDGALIGTHKAILAKLVSDCFAIVENPKIPMEMKMGEIVKLMHNVNCDNVAFREKIADAINYNCNKLEDLLFNIEAKAIASEINTFTVNDVGDKKFDAAFEQANNLYERMRDIERRSGAITPATGLPRKLSREFKDAMEEVMKIGGKLGDLELSKPEQPSPDTVRFSKSKSGFFAAPPLPPRLTAEQKEERKLHIRKPSGGGGTD